MSNKPLLFPLISVHQKKYERIIFRYKFTNISDCLFAQYSNRLEGELINY